MATVPLNVVAVCVIEDSIDQTHASKPLIPNWHRRLQDTFAAHTLETIKKREERAA